MSAHRMKNKKAPGGGAREAAKLAYERLAPQLAALKPEELLTMNPGVTKTVEHVLAAYPKIVELIPQMKQRIADFSEERVHELQDFALAVVHVQREPVREDNDPKVRDLIEEASALRRTLLLEAEALVALNKFSEDQVAAVRGGRGHRNVAEVLGSVSRLFREHWNRIADKTAVTTRHLERAERLSLALLKSLGERRLVLRKEEKQEELRAMTLLVRRYDEVRGSVVFVRWQEKDADMIAPSLYSGRVRRRRAVEPETARVATPPAAPVPAGPGSLVTP
jgi:hypothetical protein